MKAFIASCVACIAIAVVAAVVLGAAGSWTDQAFSVKDTVRLSK